MKYTAKPWRASRDFGLTSPLVVDTPKSCTRLHPGGLLTCHAQVLSPSGASLSAAAKHVDGAPIPVVPTSNHALKRLAWCTDWRHVESLYRETRDTLGAHELMAFLVQLQDFDHDAMLPEDRPNVQILRHKLLDAVNPHLGSLDADELEALTCIAGTSGIGASRHVLDAVQARLVEVLEPGAIGAVVNALNGVALCGVDPQEHVLRAVFACAVNGWRFMSPGNWRALRGLAERFPFMPEDSWFESLSTVMGVRDQYVDPDIRICVIDILQYTTFYGRRQVDDPKLQAAVDVIETSFDEYRSMLTWPQLLGFTVRLYELKHKRVDKWIDNVKSYLSAADLLSLDLSRLRRAVTLLVKREGWKEQELLARVLGAMAHQHAFVIAAGLSAEQSYRNGGAMHGGAGVSGRSAAAIGASGKMGRDMGHASGRVGGGKGDRRGIQQKDRQAARSTKVASDVLSTIKWLAKLSSDYPPPHRHFFKDACRSLVECSASSLPMLEVNEVCYLVTELQVLGISPSQDWADVCFGCIAGKAHLTDGALLREVLLGCYSLQVTPAHATLERIFSHHQRMLVDMRPADYIGILEVWLGSRFVPTRRVLENFFDSALRVVRISRPMGSMRVRELDADSLSQCMPNVLPPPVSVELESMDEEEKMALVSKFMKLIAMYRLEVLKAIGYDLSPVLTLYRNAMVSAHHDIRTRRKNVTAAVGPATAARSIPPRGDVDLMSHLSKTELPGSTVAEALAQLGYGRTKSSRSSGSSSSNVGTNSTAATDASAASLRSVDGVGDSVAAAGMNGGNRAAGSRTASAEARGTSNEPRASRTVGAPQETYLL